jgi:uncharacterized membrane protein HdeD (DUF308 family)
VFAAGAGLAVNWLALFLEGVVGVMVGLFTVFYPPAAPVMFVQLIVAWALITGVLELVGAVRLIAMPNGPSIFSEWLLASLGCLSLGLAGLLFVAPPPDPASIIAVVGGYALASGAVLVVLAFEVRRWPRVLPSAPQAL